MRKLLTIIFGLVLMCNLVTAVGVSSPYWEGNPLNAERGTTTTVNLNLQNMVGEDNIVLSAKVVDGEEIASINKESYEVTAGTSDTYVPLTISIPKDAEIGSRKTIQVEFKEITNGDGGMVVMGTGMSVGFDINITEKQKTGIPMIIYIVAILLVIAGILIAINRKVIPEAQ